MGISLALVAVFTCSLGFLGCLGDESGERDETPAHGERTSPTAAESAGGPVTASCEELGPGAGWREQAADVGRFGFLALDLSRARRLPSGLFLLKAGAVVAGHKSVVVRVRRADLGRMALVYGDATRERSRRLSDGARAVTFEPCQERRLSGFVGGILLESKDAPVRFEIQVLSDRRDLARRRQVLTLRPS